MLPQNLLVSVSVTSEPPAFCQILLQDLPVPIVFYIRIFLSIFYLRTTQFLYDFTSRYHGFCPIYTSVSQIIPQNFLLCLILSYNFLLFLFFLRTSFSQNSFSLPFFSQHALSLSCVSEFTLLLSFKISSHSPPFSKNSLSISFSQNFLISSSLRIPLTQVLSEISVTFLVSEFPHTTLTQSSLRFSFLSEFPQTFLSLRIPSDSHSFSQIPSESPSFKMSSQTHFLINSSQSHFPRNFSYPPASRFQLTHLLSEILLTSSEYSIRNLLFPRIHSHSSSLSLNSLSLSLCPQPLSLCLVSILTQKISLFIYPLLTSLHLCVCNLHLHVSLCF